MESRDLLGVGELTVNNRKVGVKVWQSNKKEVGGQNYFELLCETSGAPVEPVTITGLGVFGGKSGGMGAPNHIPEASKMVEGWYDYENQRAIKLPPVGTKCEYFDRDYGWESCTVLMHYLDGVIIAGVEGVRFSIYTFRPIDHATRKADIERKLFVDAVIAAIDTSHSYRKAASDLFDAGFRMPEDK
jgi:hypothetical protein